MKKIGRKNLTLAKETLRNLEGDDLQNVNGGIAPVIVWGVVIVGTLLLGSDTPTK